MFQNISKDFYFFLRREIFENFNISKYNITCAKAAKVLQ